MQFFKETKINFVGHRLQFFYISSIMNVVGLLAIITGFMGLHFLEPDYGIDFTGGTEIAVAFKMPVSTETLRKLMEDELKGKTSEPEIKSFGSANQYLIRITDGNEGPKIVKEALVKKYTSSQFEILKVDKIGPKIGNEMRTNALFAIFLAIGAMLLYTTFRFEFTFGLGAIIAIFHDVIVTITIILIVNKLRIINLEVNQGMLAALLTVIGFSVHDTVIVFDRIRENREKFKAMPFINLINLSINETLSRTINTVLTVVLVLLTIVVFGGPVLQGFAFTMLIGILVGTYSSIFIASSFVIWYTDKKGLLPATTGK
ncbi:MAG: protein translocase subunit SecF [Candidatus Kapabacteria bacterium]|nr:protein translocase subunit SecF [Candidatus Kapabacteria bacterium]